MSIDEITGRRESLSPAKQAVLARLLRTGIKAGAPGAAGPIRPRDPNAPAPLSGAQQRLWFLHQMDPEGAALNIPLLLRLRGPLDVPALERALAEIVRRHEALRTLFVLQGPAPVQQVLPPPARVLTVHDLPPVSADAREGAMRDWGTTEALTPFDLAAEPGIRARLLRASTDDHLLAVTLHHIVSDGWSTGVLYREMAALYAAFIRGEPSPLPPLPIQYADFAAWQRARLAGPERASQVAYWRARLAGAPTLLDLPTDRPRPAVQGTAADAHRFRVPRALLDRLAAVARAHGGTLFMALAAGWAATLHRWSGQDDVVVGTPVAGRTEPQTEPLIGFFVQTLALRMDLSGDPTFRALLERVRRTTVEAFAHQDVPFDQLVDELKVERSLSHPPLFQTTFTLQNASGAGPELPGLRAETFDAAARRAEGYLLLYAEEEEAGLNAMLQYPTDLWDAATIERMVGHFLRLLEGAAAEPDTRLSRLPLLGDDERARLLAAAAGPATPVPELPAHRMFEAQAARTPDAPAVEAEDGTRTYAELDRRANRLAHHLRARGVGPEVLVALCVQRGAAMLEALLAVLKAGGAYLPLDPDYPADRIAYMLADSGARVLITHSALLDRLPLDGIDAVVLDRDADEIAAHPDAPPAIPYSLFPIPSSLAYVIYTSGSTGRPKGVMVRHGGLANFLVSTAREPGLSAGEVLVAVTTLSFDIAVLELLLPLTVGARVRIASREAAADPERLRGLLAGATAMQATPATWRMLVDAGWTPPRDLVVLCGGEALPRDLADRLAAGGAPLWNLYGPTETTIWSAALRVPRGEGPVPVGGPLDNTQLYVLDPAMEQAPLGAFGELCIGGEGLARGYLRRPALTAERFVPDPFSRQPGARLYRTGDRVRWKESALVRECVSALVGDLPGAGHEQRTQPPFTHALTHSRTHALEFSGRLDTQVKLRGFRIELGEVEAALRGHPAVRAAAAVVREDGPGGARLVAYVVAAEGADAPAAAELRAHLGGTLPEYMLPSAFVTLDELPLTPAGKVDRRALPAPTGVPERDHVPPTTPAERLIAQFWVEALGVERVGAHDNFFEIGGHSLLVPPLHARIRAAFPREVTLVDLFRHTTVATQAAFVTERTDAAPAASPAQQRATDRAGLRRAAAVRPTRR